MPGAAKILVNHLGYEQNAAKKAALAGPPPAGAGRFLLVQQPGGEVVHRGFPGAPLKIDHWRRGSPASVLNFSACQTPGRYRVRLPHDRGVLLSAPFTVERDLLWRKAVPAVLGYLRTQRCRGVLNEADRALPFTGAREERVDVHGGWYDASGDRGKYLSHLSYTNFMNPQQPPLVVWSLLAAAELAAGRSEEQELAAGQAGEHPAADYKAAAVRSFEHLEAHNRRYLDDRRENLLDDFCALLAAVELFRLASEDRYLRAARRRAASLCARLVPYEPELPGRRDGPAWLCADNGDRPFFHASDAGLPATALCRYLETEPEADRRKTFGSDLKRILRFEISVTAEVNNPFGLARQRVRSAAGPAHNAFFMPHLNESGYWWQGENPRLASLAAAARLGAGFFAGDAEFHRRLKSYAVDQLDWILGLNPFDACMLHGFGANNPEYEAQHPNARGGICNGVTAGFVDEKDLNFLPRPYAGQGEHRWCWREQWLPHAAWYLLAVAAGSAVNGEEQ